MAWQKGQSGNPLGPQQRPWRDALRTALNTDDPATKRKKLLLLADKLVDLALAGDVQAIREIGDRIDGRAIQQIDASLSPTDDLSLEEKRAIAALVTAYVAERESVSGDAPTRH